MYGCVLVLAGGDPVPASVRDELPPADFVIAADSGLHLAPALGLRVDRIVGDLDSADRAAVDAAVAEGTEVERHPTAKDATDLELAVDAAARSGASRIVVVGGGGGRLDHLLANFLLLASPAWAGIEIEARLGARVTVVHGGRGDRRIEGEPGSLVTLAPGRRHGARHRDRRSRVPARARRARTGHVARRQQRAARHQRHGRARTRCAPRDPTPGRGRAVIVDIEVIPQPLGTETDRYGHVEAAIAIAQGAGLNYEVNALGTTIEGAPDDVWPLLRRMHDACLESGAEHVITVCKIAQHRDDGAGPSMDDLTGKFRT